MSSRQSRSHADVVRLRAWEYCVECRTPYELQDLKPINDHWTDRVLYWLCGWHYARRLAA